MNLKILLEEVIKSFEIMRGAYHKPRWIQIFMLTPQHYLEDAEKALEGETEARFLADITDKKVYVFSDQALHEQVSNTLAIEDHHQLRGYFFKAQGKLWTHKSDVLAYPWIKKFIGHRNASYD